MAKVLVTGGAGFIGSHLVEKLLKQNHQVTIVDDLSTGLEKNIPADAGFVKMDIASPELENVFAAGGFDCVFHLAAQTMVPKSIADPAFDCQVNVRGLVGLLEWCRKYGVRRIVYSSTAAVYGDGAALPVVEEAPLQFSSFYGLTKRVGEQYLELYAQLFGLEYIALRYANVYGPRQGDSGEGGVVSIFAKHIARELPLAIFGDGGQTRDFVYVGDVADANVLAMSTPVCNRIFNISTQSETSIAQLTDMLSQAAGKPVTVQHQEPRSGDIYRSVLSHAAARRDLGWQPQVALKEGLYLTYQALHAAVTS